VDVYDERDEASGQGDRYGQDGAEMFRILTEETVGRQRRHFFTSSPTVRHNKLEGFQGQTL
jgi:hypothetical protein